MSKIFADSDIFFFKQGKYYTLYEKLGSHLMEVYGVSGAYFAVWAPNAKSVTVIGDFNGWNPTKHPLAMRWEGSRIWEGFIPRIGNGVIYKYQIVSHFTIIKLIRQIILLFCPKCLLVLRLLFVNSSIVGEITCGCEMLKSTIA